MAKKKETSLEKIIIGIAIIVGGGLALAYFQGAFDSDTQQIQVSAPGGRPGATKVQ